MSVLVLMGSISDADVMRPAVDVLRGAGITVEVRVMSAHRTPDAVLSTAREARSRGVKVIIAGAGGAAHLPGVIAAVTTLPVIGIPITSGNLDGLDALLSIVQMPSGVPVATVGLDGAENAGLLALRMLGATDSVIEATLESLATARAARVEEQDRQLQDRLGAT